MRTGLYKIGCGHDITKQPALGMLAMLASSHHYPNSPYTLRKDEFIRNMLQQNITFTEEGEASRMADTDRQGL
ncbi:hypothetical protein J3459_009930 [Metarhizium acridum]|nr:hypothetical protein J3459_009930 [Metarhizium acridum]